MKKQVSPAVVVTILVVVVVLIGGFFLRAATVNPPTPRPQMFGGAKH